MHRGTLAGLSPASRSRRAFTPPMRGVSSGFTSVNALALTNDGLVWAGGDFFTEGPTPRTQLAAFDAASGAIASFNQEPSGMGITALLAVGPTVYVGGNFNHIGVEPRRFAAAVRNVPGEDGTVLPF